MHLHDTLITLIRPFYAINDPAHQLDHAIEVMTESIQLAGSANREGAGVRLSEVAAAAAFHDILVSNGREHHHLDGYNLLMDGGPFSILFTDILCKDYDIRPEPVAHAVLEHRASYDGEYYSAVSEIVSSADRGRPNLLKVFQRTMANDYNGKISSPVVTGDIRKKWGKGGYARYPALYQRHYAAELSAMQDTIADPYKMEIMYEAAVSII